MTLRPLTEADFPRLLDILHHPDVSRWWGDYDAERLRKDYLEEGSDTAFTILDRDEVAGLIGYWEEADPDYRHAGMDIFIAPEWHGTGLAQEALRTVALELVRRDGHHRLVIDPAADNERAIRAYEKLGFRAVGVMRRAERLPGRDWHDVLLMELLADELPR